MCDQIVVKQIQADRNRRKTKPLSEKVIGTIRAAAMVRNQAIGRQAVLVENLLWPHPVAVNPMQHLLMFFMSKSDVSQRQS